MSLEKRADLLHALLEKFEQSERARIEALLQTAIEVARDINISDLWEQPELARTYWILLISSESQREEMEIAQELLVWKAFSAKYSSFVLCVPHADRQYFKLCSSHFGAVKTPTLLMSDSRDMHDFVKLDPRLLFTLAGSPGNLKRFLTEIHSSIENGSSLKEIQRQLRTERFWEGMKLVYSEVKDLVSFSIGG
jgi:hypothetical protein